MRRSLTIGLVLAVCSALTIGLGELFGLDLQHVALLGAALGGVLGLVPHPRPYGKLGGFVLGFVLAWLGYALRAAVLPDSAAGRALCAFLVIAVIAAVCAVAADYAPMWSALVGVAALVGAYEETFTNAPSQFLTESVEGSTTVLLAVGLGYLVTALLNEVLLTPGHAAGLDGESAPDVGAARHGHPAGSVESSDARGDGQTNESGLDRLLSGDNT